MKTPIYRNHQWNEIIFENRNKLYGAYELRENYDERVKRAFLLVCAFITVVFGIPLVVSYCFTTPDKIASTKGNTYTLSEITTPAKTYIQAQDKKQQQAPRRTESLPTVVTKDSLENKKDPEPPENHPNENAQTNN